MADLTGWGVVITGASSGIGRETALAFARRGANVTLASRRGGQLAALARECVRAGGQAQYVETNVTDPVAMCALAQAAVKRYGKIDVWVNNAGVGAVGRFTDTPITAHEQVIRTNLLGYMNGAHAVLPYFQSGNQGVLINVVSMGAFVGMPFAASYTASKYGLRGFSESLRVEMLDYPGVRVCDVHPGFVDTPAIQHPGNYTGHEIHAHPIDRADTVAEAIVRVAVKPRNSTSVGALAKLAPLGYALAPGLGRWMAGRFFGIGIAQAPEAVHTPGNLFAATGDAPRPEPALSASRIAIGTGVGVVLLASLAALLAARR